MFQAKLKRSFIWIHNQFYIINCALFLLPYIQQLGSFAFIIFISQGLFLGSIGAAHNKDELKNLNITHILTVASSLAPAYPNEFVYKVLNG